MNWIVTRPKDGDKKDLLPYIVAQVLGGLAGAGILYVIVTGQAGAEIGSFAANGYGEHSPGGYGMTAALITEVVMTFMFLMIILGATHSKAPKNRTVNLEKLLTYKMQIEYPHQQTSKNNNATSYWSIELAVLGDTAKRVND